MSVPARFAITAVVAAFVACCALPQMSSASVRVGENCTVNGTFSGTVVQSSLNGSDVSYTMPSGGVIVEWGARFPVTTGYAGKLKMLRPSGAPATYTVIGESDEHEFKVATNSFLTRIPVKAGDVIASSGSINGAVSCGTPSAADVVNTVLSAPDPAVGSTYVANGDTHTNYRVGLHVTLEPDVDGDTYGDETQDLCPGSAKYHDACPAVKLAKYLLPPTAKGVTMLVVSSTAAPVTVSGAVSIKLPKAKASARATSFKVGPLKKTVAANAIVEFNLKFPKKLIAALKTQPKSKKFKLKLTTTGVGIANTDTTVSTVTLRGTKK
jgi:hypothetical protein